MKTIILKLYIYPDRSRNIFTKFPYIDNMYHYIMYQDCSDMIHWINHVTFTKKIYSKLRFRLFKTFNI